MFFQFTDDSKTEIASWSMVSQDDHPHEEATSTDDPRYAAYVESLPEAARTFMPAPL